MRQIESSTAYPSNWNVHQLFEEQSRRAPNNIALVFEAQRLTYGELNARANQLAHYLRALGVGPEAITGICLERSLDMVIAVLGVLKAGGAWLPLDPTYPKDRQLFMLKHSRVSVLLTATSLLAQLPEHDARTVLLDASWPLISQHCEANLDDNTDPTNLAYVIYTSGSTGQPKGVMIPHANLVHYVDAMAAQLGVGGGDTYLHTASFAFSSSVRQLMVPLTSGARVVIAAANTINDPIALFKMIQREKVTIIDIVPSYLRHCLHALARLEDRARTSLLDNRLRLILTASESLTADLPRKWLSERTNPAALINMFGQTETTGIVAAYPIAPNNREHEKIVPIGRAVHSAHIYVLDPELRPVPAGAIGEIYVDGATLARGYHHQPELTAEKFIPNPFSADAGARLYKTGDLGRDMNDGNIAFVGRTDEQIKIRGFRVELGEIEAALNDYEALREAVVINREDVTGESRLIAYVVCSSGETPATDLREFLARRLPDYMLPTDFVFLESLPRTPSGKVDRRGLPKPGWKQRPTRITFVAPRTHVEKTLCSIWSEVLKLDKVGIQDNFFDLGGNSLSALQVIFRVRDALHVEPPRLAVFETATLAHLAELVEATLWSRAGVESSAGDPGGSNEQGEI